MALKNVKWENETLGRQILSTEIVGEGRVLKRRSLRIRREPEGINVRYVSLLTTDFDACDGYTGYVCPFCGHTERTSGCECASCGVRR